MADGPEGRPMQHSPAGRRTIAELPTTGGLVFIDLSRFGVARVTAGRPILVQNAF